jgi:VanZ family protein
VSPNRKKLVIWASLLMAVLVAIGIEFAKIYLPPLVPDISNAIVYLIGYAVGYFLLAILQAPAPSSLRFVSLGPQFPEDSVADLGLTLATPQMRESRQRTLWFLGGLTLLAIAGYGSLVPFNYSPREFSDAWAEFVRSGSKWEDWTSVDWGVNVMLLIPSSFCFVAAALRRNSSLLSRLAWSAAVLVGCIAFSVLIELSQCWFPPNVPKLIDVAAQACGAIIGIVAWWICGPTLSSLLQK